MANKLILYSYYSNDIYEENFDFFIKNGFIDSPEYTFVLIINGERPNKKIHKKIKVLKRENTGFDFGGWGFGLNSFNIKNFDKFIFINSTCVGPFVPRYMPSNLTWVDLFTCKLTEKIKLCGPTINYINKLGEYSPHIQSFAFATDLIGLNMLIKENIFNPKNDIERNSLIENHEVKMSKIITQNNFDLYAFQLSENNPEIKMLRDIHFENFYFGDTINPLEVMFVKNKRINNITLKNYVDFNS